MKTIAIANQKGGVAKTTSTYNIGVALARKGHRVLLVDLDAQGSLTVSAGLEPFDNDRSIVNVLKRNGTPMADCIISLKDHLSICPCRLELAQLEMEMMGRSMRELILARGLEPVRNDYDFCLIDCPPQLSILTINALSSADYVIIPVKTDYLAYRGVELLMNSIHEVKELINPRLEVLGVVATMYEKRVKDDNEVLQLLSEEYHLIGTIKKAAIVKKGVYNGQTVADQDARNDVAKEYDKIADLLIAKGAVQ